MVKVYIKLDKKGVFTELVVTGHAKNTGLLSFLHTDANTVCTAVSVLLETLKLTLELQKGIEFKHIDKKHYYIRIDSYNVETELYLNGITEYVMLGLKAMEQKYPNLLSIETEA